MTSATTVSSDTTTKPQNIKADQVALSEKYKDLKLPASYSQLRSIPLAAPTVVVMDTFSKPEKLTDASSLDIDGDGFACSTKNSRDDLLHGEVVSRIIEDGNVRVFRWPLGDNLLESLSQELSSLTAKRDAGALKQIKGLAIPITIPLSIEKLKYYTGQSDITAQNLAENRERIINGLETIDDRLGKSRKTSSFHDATRSIRELEKLTAQGMEVFIAGGNDGPDSINLLCLAKGTKQIAAKAKNSCKNNLTFSTTDGKLKHQRVAGGYDLNGNGTLDVLGSELTAGPHPEKDLDGKSMPALCYDLPKDYKSQQTQAEYPTLEKELYDLAYPLNPGLYSLAWLHSQWKFKSTPYELPKNAFLQIHNTGEVFLFKGDTKGTLHLVDLYIPRVSRSNYQATSIAVPEAVVDFYHNKTNVKQ